MTVFLAFSVQLIQIKGFHQRTLWTFKWMHLNKQMLNAAINPKEHTVIKEFSWYFPQKAACSFCIDAINLEFQFSVLLQSWTRTAGEAAVLAR